MVTLFNSRLLWFPPLAFPGFSRIRGRRGKLGLGLKLGHECCRRRMAYSASVKACSSSVKVRDHVELSEKERKIFDVLLNVVKHFNLQTQLRVAGGWVRDKLLGRDCYDIDLALDNMLGKEFGDKVYEYLVESGEESKEPHIIKSNPDQSKHLETAKMRICDTEIDFVNLRSETYVENSRIPTMKFGTAVEDAYRRDLTINSLFYNINTNSVEDLTGRGIADLKAGMIVTPLPPKATFLDDPLRVLRAIRFGARFEFVLHDDLKKAASNEEVKAALAEKISRERIGHEVDLMVSGNQPVTAMTYICDLQLFWIVFSLPINHEPVVKEDFDRLCIAFMNAAWNVLQQIGYSTFNDDQRRLLLYASLFLPLRESNYMVKKSKKVISLHTAAERFTGLIPLLTSNEDFQDGTSALDEEFITAPLASRRRIFAGLILRDIKEYWRAALLISTLLRCTVPDCTRSSIDGYSEVDQRVALYRRIEESIVELGLENVWEVKPLVDGKAIMEVLRFKTGGPQVREWQGRVVKWQLAHPSATHEECLEWLQQSNAKRAKLN
ncbi:putative CCA tRNA nucleotidyltransferase 2 isoform X2 [Amborella trichopoda]|uniref:putative CCA tRNA nucleotidyltransferase 2 isoform X2 n=1 Tax=Amborella trichopoda TaxID=13333 RepID=UPI0009BFE5BF|nr:putative CCA tRNA nucleotidyltransferase 2 isoform X2 [Amborella trichopoda]|eukprot:XP_011624323.2 putative CCA tRNA nucleotidyltransferase 2 isoform X2 [Amborella trichopoda]